MGQPIFTQGARNLRPATIHRYHAPGTRFILFAACLTFSACFSSCGGSQSIAEHPSSKDTLRNSEESLRKARQAITADDLDLAIRSAQAALQIDPTNARAHYELARILEIRNDYPGALASLQRSLELDEDFAPAWRLLGYLRLNEGQWQRASAASQRALDLEPQDPAAQVNMGYALQRLGQPDRAYYHYQKALAMAPEHRQGLLYSGILLTDMRRLDEARRRFTAAVRFHPNDPEAHFRLGALLATEFLEPSNKSEREIIFDQQNTTSVSKPILRQARFHLERSLELQSNLVEAHRLLAYLHLRAGDYREAALAAANALNKNPGDDATRYNLALANYYSEDFVAAREEFARVLKRYPMTEQANLLHANACLRTGELDGAIESYSRVLQVNPQNATAHLNLATIYERRGDAALAFKHREAACAAGLKTACE